MKDKIYLVLVSLFIFLSTTLLFSGIKFNYAQFGFILAGLLWGISMLAVPRIISFLTLKHNIVISIFVSIVLSVGVLYFLDMLTPLISFQNGVLKGIIYPTLLFKDIPLEKNLLIGVFGSFCATINSLMMLLIK